MISPKELLLTRLWFTHRLRDVIPLCLQPDKIPSTPQINFLVLYVLLKTDFDDPIESFSHDLANRIVTKLYGARYDWSEEAEFSRQSIDPHYEEPFAEDEEYGNLINYIIEVMIANAEFDPPIMKIIDDLVDFLRKTDVQRIMADIGNDQRGDYYDQPYSRFLTFFAMLYWGKRYKLPKDARTRMKNALRELLGGDVQEVVKLALESKNWIKELNHN